MDQVDTQLDIIIIGAGLAGLAAAVSCALNGHNVTVLEGARELAEIGAGLQITPNGSRLFKKWGIFDNLEKLGAEPEFCSVHRFADGKVLAHDPNFKQNMHSRYAAPFIDLHRVDVQRALASRAKELGVALKLATRIISIDFNQPRVVAESGEEFTGDLVVAADGLWSKSRECYLGRKDAPIPTGDLAYRIVLSLDDVEDPELRAMITNPQLHFWIGPDAHVVAYSLRGGSMYNIVLLVPDDLPADVAKQPGSIEEMQQFFTGWDPILTRFLKCVKTVDKWKLMHRNEMDAWVNDKSNFVMIGDCCHPMLPYLAQGANSAMEDGAVLGGLLGNLQTRAELPHALELFQRLRKSRGEAIARETFKQRKAFHMADGPEQEARDALFAATLGTELTKEFPSRWTCPIVQPWLYGYDADKEVEAALNTVRFLNSEADSPSEAAKLPAVKVSEISSH